MYAGVGSLSELAEPAPSDPIENDTIEDLSDIFEKPKTTILPLWEVQVTLTEESTGSEVVIHPTIDDFQAVLSNMLSQYERVLRGFGPPNEDHRIKPFLRGSKFDLLQTLEKDGSKYETVDWLNYEGMLHSYAPYQSMVHQLEKCISLTIVEANRKLKVNIYLYILYNIYFPAALFLL